MRRFLLLAAIVGLAGCTQSSGVMDTGEGTYAVTASAGSIVGGSDKAAHDQAEGFCERQGRHAVVMDIARPLIGNKVELHFRCG